MKVVGDYSAAGSAASFWLHSDEAMKSRMRFLEPFWKRKGAPKGVMFWRRSKATCTTSAKHGRYYPDNNGIPRDQCGLKQTIDTILSAPRTQS